MPPRPDPDARKPHVIIVGAGFGGLSAAKALAGAAVDVTLIDRRNHHLFQPLLYQVATAGLTPSQIASPVRSILRDDGNVRVVLADVDEIDVARREVVTGARRTPFDYLVVAAGAGHAYFGHDEWAPHAPGLKSLEDALALRARILTALEAAETACDPAERARLLTFAVVGGGPTGVELAGAIAELTGRALMSDFRAIRREMARVLLIEAGERLLPAFHPDLSAYAARALRKLGVEVRLGSAVSAVNADGVRLGDERIDAANVAWAAGVRAAALGRWLGQDADRAGRIPVAPDLSLPGAPEIFVIGDLAKVTGPDGRPVPGVAPAAKQQGAYVGRLIRAAAAGRPRPPPFRYRDFGSLATVGRRAAVVELGGFRLKGAFAWLFWCVAHIWFLIGFRNRLQVTLDWIWAYLTFERGARLITGDDQAQAARTAHVAGGCACVTL